MQIKNISDRSTTKGGVFSISLVGPMDINEFQHMAGKMGLTTTSELVWKRAVDGGLVRADFLGIEFSASHIQDGLRIKPFKSTAEANDGSEVDLPESATMTVNWESFKVSPSNEDLERVLVELKGQVKDVTHEAITAIHEYIRFGLDLDAEWFPVQMDMFAESVGSEKPEGSETVQVTVGGGTVTFTGKKRGRKPKDEAPETRQEDDSDQAAVFG